MRTYQIANRGLLARVVAPHFVAGLVLDARGYCVEAAPILHWALGKHRSELRAAFARRGWDARVLATVGPEPWWRVSPPRKA